MSEVTEGDLKARVAELERSTDELLQIQVAHAAPDAEEASRFLAMYSIARELAMELGLSGASFPDHFKKRFDWFYERELLRIGDKSPTFAARIDSRLHAAEPVEGLSAAVVPKNRNLITYAATLHGQLACR